MTERILTQEETELIRDMLYDRAKHSRLFHRTGENVTEPLFSSWIPLANLFRDAVVITIRVEPQP